MRAVPASAVMAVGYAPPAVQWPMEDCVLATHLRPFSMAASHFGSFFAAWAWRGKAVVRNAPAPATARDWRAWRRVRGMGGSRNRRGTEEEEYEYEQD